MAVWDLWGGSVGLVGVAVWDLWRWQYMTCGVAVWDVLGGSV